MTDRRVHCPIQGCPITTEYEAEMDAHVLTPHPAGTAAGGPYGTTLPLGRADA